MDNKGVNITVRGKVQGVGFRYYSFQRANALTLTGWVRNNSNGSVTVCVRGESNKIKQIIEQLKAGPGAPFISESDIEWLETVEQYSSFEIKM